jgi:hypothetical protein
MTCASGSAKCSQVEHQLSPTIRLSISVKNAAGKSFRVSLAQ